MFALVIGLSIVVIGLVLSWRATTRTTRLAASLVVLLGAAALAIFHPARGQEAARRAQVAQYCKDVGFGLQMLQLRWTNMSVAKATQSERWTDLYDFVLGAAKLCLEGPRYTCAERAMLPVSDATSTRNFTEAVAAFHDGKDCTP